MSSKKTPLNEEPFGIRSMERLDVGDLVQWSELGPNGYDKEKKIGVIAELYLEKRVPLFFMEDQLMVIMLECSKKLNKLMDS